MKLGNLMGIGLELEAGEQLQQHATLPTLRSHKNRLVEKNNNNNNINMFLYSGLLQAHCSHCIVAAIHQGESGGKV